MGLSIAVDPDPELGALNQDRAPRGAAANPDLDWLEGRTIVHKIGFGLTDPALSVLAILNELVRTPAQIRALTLKPTEGRRFKSYCRRPLLTQSKPGILCAASPSIQM